MRCLEGQQGVWRCTDNMLSDTPSLFHQQLCSFVMISGMLHLCTHVYLLQCRFIWFYGPMLCSLWIDYCVLYALLYNIKHGRGGLFLFQLYACHVVSYLSTRKAS